jgi:hypothetical protein
MNTAEVRIWGEFPGGTRRAFIRQNGHQRSQGNPSENIQTPGKISESGFANKHCGRYSKGGVQVLTHPGPLFRQLTEKRVTSKVSSAKLNL